MFIVIFTLLFRQSLFSMRVRSFSSNEVISKIVQKYFEDSTIDHRYPWSTVVLYVCPRGYSVEFFPLQATCQSHGQLQCFYAQLQFGSILYASLHSFLFMAARNHLLEPIFSVPDTFPLCLSLFRSFFLKTFNMAPQERSKEPPKGSLLLWTHPQRH